MMISNWMGGSSVQACPKTCTTLIRVASVKFQVAYPSHPTGSLRQKEILPPRLPQIISFKLLNQIMWCGSKVGQMFNALGLGFSFVLSFLILPEDEGDNGSEEGIGESRNGTDCSNSSLTLDHLTPVGTSTHSFFLSIPLFVSLILPCFCFCQSPLWLACL